ncbi:MAG: hypothetical protein H0U95_05020 [Bacteroidetes bacterium]|nr:hypothetical protein [Bacteroidota bacterium]
MPIQFDKFEQSKIDRLKNHLSTLADKNKAKFYEIIVDGLKAVPKTDEISDFDAYEDYITKDTEQIKIVIYNTALSPRNDQYVFILQAKDKDEALNIGLNGVPLQKFSRNSISEWRENKARKDEQQIEILRLKRECSDLKAKNQFNEEYIDELEKQIEKAKRNGNTIGGFHLGDILSVAAEGLINRNKDGISKIPFLSGLAGITKKEPESLEATKSEKESEASFQKMDEAATNPALSEEDAVMLELIKQIENQFTEDEFGTVLDIVDAMAKDKELIVSVSELTLKDEAGE